MIETPQTRESLILRLPTAGDAAAWQEFATIYEPLVYRFARSRGLQDADARELVQDVFLAVAKAVSNWQPDANRGKFRTWLFRIARNQLISMLRKRQPAVGTGKTSAMMSLQQVEMTNSEMDELETSYRKELFRVAAANIRDRVQPNTWQSFWWTCVEGRSIEAVARQLNLSRGAVYIARSRVLHQLRELIQTWENDDA